MTSSLTSPSLDTVTINPVMSPVLGTGYAQLAVTTEEQRRPCASHGVMIGFPTAPGPNIEMIGFICNKLHLYDKFQRVCQHNE